VWQYTWDRRWLYLMAALLLAVVAAAVVAAVVFWRKKRARNRDEIDSPRRT
jgi:hypothetical protein